ncbi:MAG TPA: c-type cytochrome [Gemmatimonadaceae bacterium]|nr:c-type cytochrome [Gemmatimonadaceae bacterium]
MRGKFLFVLAAAAAPLGAQAAADTTSPELIASGKKVFEGKAGGAICFSCHGMNARGMPGVGPDLTDGKWLHGDGGIAFLEKLIAAGVARPKQSVAAMPPMGGAKLDATQIRALAAYIASLNAKKD